MGLRNLIRSLLFGRREDVTLPPPPSVPPSPTPGRTGRHGQVVAPPEPTFAAIDLDAPPRAEAALLISPPTPDVPEKIVPLAPLRVTPEPSFAALEIGEVEKPAASLPVPPRRAEPLPGSAPPPPKPLDLVADLREELGTAIEQLRQRAAAFELPLEAQEELPPVSPAASPPPRPSQSSRWEKVQRQKASPNSFLSQARGRARMTRNAAVPVPLQSYWTTYADLDRARTDWYYFWRARLRAGEALPTDLSYVFLHVYEVLHGVGFDRPEAAFAHLQHVWRTYRVDHPKLDHYLVDWLSDFVHYYGLKGEAARAWLDEASVYARGEELLHHWLERGDRAEVPAGVFRELVAYRPEQNKFYRDTPDKAALDATLRHAVRLTDEFYRETTGTSVFEALRPKKPRQIQRRAFSGAVFEGPSYEYVAATLWPYREDGRLSELLTQAVRHAENLARKRAGFKSQLRGVELPLDLAAYLDTHLFPQQEVRRTVRLDAGRLAALQQESEAIRERLLDEDGGEAAAPVVVLPAEAPAPPQPGTPAAQRFTLPANVPEGHLTDVETVADILEVASGAARDLLRQLRAQGWEAPEADLQLPTGTFASTLVDEVNEAAQLKLGDVLLVQEGALLVAVEDYRDELEFLLGVLEQAPAEVTQAPATLEGPWQALADALPPLHLVVLEQLLRGGLTLRELEAFTAARHALASAVLEDLNTHALDTVGDILVDPYGDPLALDDAYRYDVLRLLQAKGLARQEVNA
ncbi:hypothetical protein Dcar01_01783 [Deinococcus carri]|uniref:TerB-C domain-containing protein n=1 Tax=Deinococcus carri TaxID=1211323 RepID=A0ABP9W6R2_9DEIO